LVWSITSDDGIDRFATLLLLLAAKLVLLWSELASMLIAIDFVCVGSKIRDFAMTLAPATNVPYLLLLKRIIRHP